ncbi:unnamed protein product [Scytosiphon promiscuus]
MLRLRWPRSCSLGNGSTAKISHAEYCAGAVAAVISDRLLRHCCYCHRPRYAVSSVLPSLARGQRARSHVVYLYGEAKGTEEGGREGREGLAHPSHLLRSSIT